VGALSTSSPTRAGPRSRGSRCPADPGPAPLTGAGDHDAAGHAEGRRGGVGCGFGLGAEAHGASTVDEKDTGAGEVAVATGGDSRHPQGTPLRHRTQPTHSGPVPRTSCRVTQRTSRAGARHLCQVPRHGGHLVSKPGLRLTQEIGDPAVQRVARRRRPDERRVHGAQSVPGMYEIEASLTPRRFTSGPVCGCQAFGRAVEADGDGRPVWTSLRDEPPVSEPGACGGRGLISLPGARPAPWNRVRAGSWVRARPSGGTCGAENGLRRQGPTTWRIGPFGPCQAGRVE
jgi:hypothetical protein